MSRIPLIASSLSPWLSPLAVNSFTGVFLEHNYEIVKWLQGLGHLCAMTGYAANNIPAISHATLGIAIKAATNTACGAIVLTTLGPSTIVHAIRGSCIIFQHMRNYSIYACVVTIHLGRQHHWPRVIPP
ncbi:plasma membrane H+ ATPase [Mycena olivaceomarginata]|nr:plasma membrane H+ ATPase [Mycena olivaceomarginata]